MSGVDPADAFTWPVDPMSPEWFMLATKTEHLADRSDGVRVEVYHFDVDPASGLRFATVAVIASGIMTNGRSVIGVASCARRLWDVRFIRRSQIAKAVKTCLEQAKQPE